MPTYEYACTSCGFAWEAVQKISEAALTDCPQCKAASAKRQISGGNFILKGGGWYADLYSSSGGSKKAESASSPAASAPKTESAPSTEAAKPAAAAPAATPAAKPST
ncbi:MAG: zinc ribbon domain-containing protein [Polyangiaceae bacterium]